MWGWVSAALDGATAIAEAVGVIDSPTPPPTQVVPKPDPTKAEIGESLYDVRACGRCGVKLDRRKAKSIGKTHYCPKPCYQEEERDRAATAKFLSRVSLDKI